MTTKFPWKSNNNIAWKPNYVDPDVLACVFRKQKKTVWSRDSVVPEYLAKRPAFIQNGKDLIKTYITPEKIGLKFGDLSYTRRFTRKIDKKIKKKKQPKKK